MRGSVAADKGADISEFLHKPSDTEFLLRTPLGLQALGPVLPTIHLREGNFSDFNEGGWQEWFPVAGDFPADHKGAQLDNTAKWHCCLGATGSKMIARNESQ